MSPDYFVTYVSDRSAFTGKLHRWDEDRAAVHKAPGKRSPALQQIRKILGVLNREEVSQRLDGSFIRAGERGLA